MIVHHFSPVAGALHPDFVFRGACRGVHSKFLLNWVEIKKKKKDSTKAFLLHPTIHAGGKHD